MWGVGPSPYIVYVRTCKIRKICDVSMLMLMSIFLKACCNKSLLNLASTPMPLIPASCTFFIYEAYMYVVMVCKDQVGYCAVCICVHAHALELVV